MPSNPQKIVPHLWNDKEAREAVAFYASVFPKSKVDGAWEKLAVGGTALMPLDKYPFSERYGWIQDKVGGHG